MSTVDSPRARARGQGKPKRDAGRLLGVAALALATLLSLMAYSIVLLQMGLNIEIVAVAEFVLCLLTAQVVRSIEFPDSPLPHMPRLPWLSETGRPAEAPSAESSSPTAPGREAA